MIDEKRIQIAAKLYDTRETMKRLHGDKFAEKIKEFQGFIRSEMQQKNCNELTATMNIVRDLQRDRPDSGMAQAMILAACVELIEPSSP